MAEFTLTTDALRFPPYVFGRVAAACLVHRVIGVQFHWRLGKDDVRRFSHASIRCACGQGFFVHTSTLCEIPNIDAVDCGRCWGKEPVFRKHGDYAKRKEAHNRLGCVVSS